MSGREDPAAAPEGSPNDLAVPVTPVPSGRRPRGPWVALAAMVAIIGLALVASRLFPAAQDHAVIVLPTSTAAPRPTLAPATPTPLAADELRAGLNDGSLAGSLVVVDGMLEGRAIPCLPGVARCRYLELVGLEGVPIEPDAAIAASVAADVPGGGSLVFRAGRGTLTLLGTTRDSIDAPMTVAELLAVEASWPEPPGPEDLVPVSGRLVEGGVEPCHPASTAGRSCPATGPRLTDVGPAPGGRTDPERGMVVHMEPGARPRFDGAITTGPFLLRYDASRGGDLLRWHVAAIVDPAHVVGATVP